MTIGGSVKFRLLWPADSFKWNYTYIIKSVLNGQIRFLCSYDMPNKSLSTVYRQSPAVF